eukprot:COSAG02_NODE_23203_length_726_cov_1.647528_1_plen_147_part_00
MRRQGAPGHCYLSQPKLCLPLSFASSPAGKAQRWSFGPSGAEYLLRWDGAPTPNKLGHALKYKGASTVEFQLEPGQRQQRQQQQQQPLRGAPWVEAVPLSSQDEDEDEQGKEDKEEAPSPPPPAKRHRAATACCTRPVEQLVDYSG